MERYSRTLEEYDPKTHLRITPAILEFKVDGVWYFANGTRDELRSPKQVVEKTRDELRSPKQVFEKYFLN